MALTFDSQWHVTSVVTSMNVVVQHGINAVFTSYVSLCAMFTGRPRAVLMRRPVCDATTFICGCYSSVATLPIALLSVSDSGELC